MFKKLFGRTKVPTENGNPEPKVDQLRWVKSYHLELSNMEGTPAYPLSHQLSVGSEIGNIVINDPSISPRHATFSLQQGVVSVVDHSSVAGTFINDHKLPPGKTVLLEDSDVVRLGDLDIKIVVKNETIDEADIPALPPEHEFDLDAVEEDQDTRVITREEDKEEGPKAWVKTHEQKPNPEKIVPKRANVRSFYLRSYQATNALPRVLAVGGDFILAYILLVLLTPFDEFRELLNFVPQLIADLLGMEWSQIWASIKTEIGLGAEVIEDLTDFLTSRFPLLNLIIVFMLIRLATTFIFGVSISELVLGVRGGMHWIWARIGGVLRVIISFITGPLLIFDLPAIVSKRTFKEVITHTNTYIHSRLLTFLGTIIYLPLLVALAFVAPVFKGLELPQGIPLNTKIDERVKVAEAPEAAPEIAPDAAPEDSVAGESSAAEAPDSEAPAAPEPPITPVTRTSQHLRLELSYSPDEVSVIPAFHFQGGKNKLKISGQLVFIHKDTQRPVEFELYKTFDLRQLLGLGMRGNIFLFDTYPQIYEFVYSSPEANPSFKSRTDDATHAAFAKEFIDFADVSLSLDEQNFLDIMQSKTPLLNGLMEFKSSFLSLIEDQDFSGIGFIKIGNVVFMRISYDKASPYDLIIPLMKGEGRIYKVAFDRPENLNDLANKFYKFTLYESDWQPPRSKSGAEVLNSFEVLDTLTVDLAREGALSPEKAQALYGYYFEKSIQVLQSNSVVEYGHWKNSVQSLLQIFEAMKPAADPSQREEVRQKLIQNFKDMFNAIENRNLNYFGIKTSTQV